MRLFFKICFLSFVILSCSAQDSLNRELLKIYTEEQGTIVKIIINTQYEIYVLRSFLGGKNIEESFGSIDIVIEKYDLNCNELWSKRIGTTDMDVAIGMVKDKNENIYIAGHTSGYLNRPETRKDELIFNIFLIKMTKEGNIVWMKQYESEETYEINSIKISSEDDESILIAALKRPKMASGMYVYLKYNLDGEPIWEKEIGNENELKIYAMDVDAKSNIYFTGDARTERHDLFLMGYNEDGKKKWELYLGNDNYNESNALTHDSHNNIYVTGSTKGIFNKTSENIDIKYRNNTIYISKINDSGEIVWIKYLAEYEEYPCTAYFITVDKLDNIYIAGMINLSSNDPLKSIQETILSKLDPDGNILWTKVFQEKNYNSPTDLFVDDRGIIFMGVDALNAFMGNVIKGFNNSFLLKMMQ